MTDQPVAASAPQTTGNPSVDAVLDLVAGLDDRPLDEHVEVFESAHAELRGALDEPGDPRDSGGPARG